jgi:hypothetical protein
MAAQPIVAYVDKQHLPRLAKGLHSIPPLLRLGDRWLQVVVPGIFEGSSLLERSRQLLLIEWNTMYDDYFAKARRKKNQKRIHETVKNFHRLEKKTLVTETGALGKTYGDWDIHTPTDADVALACRYEGHGFEQGLTHLEDGVSDREVRSLMRQLYNALKTELDRRIAKKKKPLQRDRRTFRMQRGGERSES